MIFKFAFRDIIRHWHFTLFFIFNLTIGLTGFVTLESFKESLQNYLSANAKQILAADISVESRRELTQVELDSLGQIPFVENSIVYDFFAMVAGKDQAKLVFVKAIDNHFPMYGHLKLASNLEKNLDQNTKDGKKNIPKIWVYPEILEALDVQVGQILKIGKAEFLIDDVVVSDTTQTFRSASLAPRIYLPISYLADTELIQFGSTFTKQYLFKLKSSTEVSSIREKIYEIIPDPAVRVETPDSASEDAGRQLKLLSDYLGLVTLVALFLSALGAAYLFRLYLQQKVKDIAIIRSLGLKTNRALKIYLLQTLILGTMAIVLSNIFCVILFPIVDKLLLRLLPFSLNLKPQVSVFWVGFLLAVFGSMAISLPFLLKIREIAVAELFSEEVYQSQIQNPKWLAWLPALFLFVFLSVYQSHSLKLGLSFCLGLIVVLGILAIIAYFSISFLTCLKFGDWRIRYAFLSLNRKKISALTLFVSLALGALLINILPQLKVTLQSALSVSQGSPLPSLFVFDVQDEQVENVKSFIKEQNQVALDFSPLIRARITKLNGKDFERNVNNNKYQTREEERDNRFRNRGINLTYRGELGEAEEIIEGRPFAKQVNPELAELSVEHRYADRLGLKINDILVFDIQGVGVSGQIVNLRSVRWTSFRPNFFIVVQPGFLEDAPKTHIGALARMDNSVKANLQRKLVGRFANISLIDLDRLVTEILKVAEQMSLALELMAWLSILAGFVVLYSIVQSQTQTRRWELNMLKILGAHDIDLKIYLFVEVLVVTTMASMFGALISLIVSALLSRFIFESPLKINLLWIFGSILGINFLSLIVSWLAARKVMQEKPQQILI
jgi:putative ABC transport system permease protein